MLPVDPARRPDHPPKGSPGVAAQNGSGTSCRCRAPRPSRGGPTHPGHLRRRPPPVRRRWCGGEVADRVRGVLLREGAQHPNARQPALLRDFPQHCLFQWLLRSHTPAGTCVPGGRSASWSNTSNSTDCPARRLQDVGSHPDTQRQLPHSRSVGVTPPRSREIPQDRRDRP